MTHSVAQGKALRALELLAFIGGSAVRALWFLGGAGDLSVQIAAATEYHRTRTRVRAELWDAAARAATPVRCCCAHPASWFVLRID